MNGISTRSAAASMGVPALALLAMLAFAGNSLLCRLALQRTDIDPASFTALRLLSGTAMLLMLVALRGHCTLAARPRGRARWLAPLALFGYMAGFSFAYVELPAATGALLLFGAVQATMIGVSLWRGERLRGRRLAGFVLALGGLVGFLLPGLSAPPPGAAMLMLGAGVAWAVYSLRGRDVADPLGATARNFMFAALPGALLALVFFTRLTIDLPGMLCALASGAIASGLGYAVWYAVVPKVGGTVAATMQLSVPVLTALGGAGLLGEPLSLRLALAGAAILGGIALVVMRGAA